MPAITIQQQAVKLTEQALQALFRTARHVPADKRSESPMGAARSVHSQLAECASTARFIGALLQGNAPDLGGEAGRERRAQMEVELATLEAAEAAATESYNAFYEQILALTDEQLGETHYLPFGGGMTLTTADLLFIPYQNLVYHTGQINYYQLMLGDTEMH